MQLVVCLTEESDVLCSINGSAHNFLETDHDGSNERSQRKFYWRNTLKCLSIGTPKTFNFPFVSNGKLKCLGVPILKHNIGTPKTINFPFVSNGKSKCLGVPILKHNRVLKIIPELSPLPLLIWSTLK